MSRPGLLLYFDVLPALDKLPHAAVGELLLAALHYAQDSTEPVFDDPSLGFAWAFLRPSIDRDGATYNEKKQRGDWLTYCRQCKRDGTQALDFETWRERVYNGTLVPVDVSSPTPTSTPITTPTPTSTSNNIIVADKPPPPARKKFTPPSLDEVTEYVQERGSRVDPQGFIDFYASKGWMVGKSQMKDWKAACRNAEKWERWDRPRTSDRNRLRTADEYESSNDFFGGGTSV